MRIRTAAAVLVVVLAGTVSACGGGSDPGAASTPAGAETVQNTAPQTVDEQGFPVQTAPPAGGGGGGQAGGDTTPTEGGGGGEPAAPSGDPQAGLEVFSSAGCGGCHALAEAGSSGTIGPDLDQSLAGKDAEYVRRSIVDPNADIAAGFPPNVMPGTYGDQLQPKQIDDLVALLTQ